VNASCTLLNDVDASSGTQFLLSYPGSVVLYATNTTPMASAMSQVTITQSAAVMW
jgi:quinolinate synthase